MRASKEYISVTSSVSMKRLAEKYMIQGTVGDQDWLTVLGWEMEDMFYLLPCQYNVQMDQVYSTEESCDVLDDYNKCDAKTRIFHRNGET